MELFYFPFFYLCVFKKINKQKTELERSRQAVVSCFSLVFILQPILWGEKFVHLIKMFQSFCCNSVFRVLHYFSHWRREKKKEAKTDNMQTCIVSEKQGECKTTKGGFCGQRRRADLREPLLPVQKDTQKWEKVWLLFFHVRQEETTGFVLAAWVKCHVGNHSRVWPEGGFITNINSNWTRPHLARWTENVSWVGLSPEHQPDLDCLALENQKQRVAEREATASSTMSSTISSCRRKKCIF